MLSGVGFGRGCDIRGPIAQQVSNRTIYTARGRVRHRQDDTSVEHAPILGHFCSQRRACRPFRHRAVVRHPSAAPIRVRHDAAAEGPARTTLSRRFFLRQFCSRRPRRRPAPTGRAKAAPVRGIADSRQSHRHRECGLLHRRCRPRRRERPSRHHNVCSDRAQLRREPSGFQRRMCQSCRRGAFRASFHECFLVRPVCRLSLCHPACTDRRGQCPGAVPASPRRLTPSRCGDSARESPAGTAESPAVPEPRQRGDARVAPGARRVPRAPRRLQQCRLRR